MLLALFLIALLPLALGQDEIEKYGHNSPVVSKDSDQVAKHFPKPNITLLSPAFISPETVPKTFANGTTGPTDLKTFDSFLQQLAKRNRWVSYANSDFKSDEGLPLPYVRLAAHEPRGRAAGTKLRIWIQGGVHGDEPAGDQAVLALLGKMDADQTWTKSVLENIEFLIVPRYNVDGVANFQRKFVTNMDPNRDHIGLRQQTTRNIKTIFNQFAPHIAVDLHEYTAPRNYAPGHVSAGDALFSAAKNLNINENLRSLAEEKFVPPISAALEAAGFRWEPYVTKGTPPFPGGVLLEEAGTDGKIGRNGMGMTQTVTFLFETRGIALADQEFHRRTACGLTMLQAIINTAVTNYKEVYSTIESGIQEFISDKSDIIITDSPRILNTTFQMIAISNGSLVDYPIQFASVTPAIANLTRSRPSAYIIPAGWWAIAERMRGFGLSLEYLPNGFHGKVEALNITSVEFAKEYFESVILTTITTEVVKKELTLPPGSFRLKTAQRNAALAFVALEPENIDSYASFNIIETLVGDEYPIYREI